MSIDTEFIHDYMNFIIASAPETDTRYGIRYNLPDIDVEVVSRITTGPMSQMNILVYHETYLVRYKKIWTIKKTHDSTDIIEGTITMTVEGDEEVFSQHLVLLKLL